MAGACQIKEGCVGFRGVVSLRVCTLRLSPSYIHGGPMGEPSKKELYSKEAGPNHGTARVRTVSRVYHDIFVKLSASSVVAS